MTDNREDEASDHATRQQQHQIHSSTPDSLDDETTETLRPTVILQAPPFLPIYDPKGTPTSPAQTSTQRQFETANPKRPRFGTGQWKLLTSSTQHQGQMKHATSTQMVGISTESTPSPSTTHAAYPTITINPQMVPSSGTASSPSHSPVPSHPETMTTKAKPESEARQHHQFRKGKYVSPVWKPNEMLWLSRAWSMQYQGCGSDSTEAPSGSDEGGLQPTRGKTRAEKDREVAEFLNHHGVNRDAKTAGTKWDNMLGEFRKVYEWERGGEREQLVGKSYFRLSPYERKLHRLPASFDEEVFEELSQFMGPRMRSSHRPSPSIVSSGDFEVGSGGIRALPPPPPFKDDDPLSAAAGRSRHFAVITSGVDSYFPGSIRTVGGHGVPPSVDLGVASTSSSAGVKDLVRIGKVRMTWEESVSLWGEEGDHHSGRIMVRGSSFLYADELSFFDDSMVFCAMECFEEGGLAGLSVDRFVTGQQVKVIGRRKMTSNSEHTTTGSAYGFGDRILLPFPERSIIPQLEFQDPTDYFLGCLKVPPETLPDLLQLSRYIVEPPPEELRFPLRKDVYRDLPTGKELFFTTSHDLLDCRSITYEIISSLVRPYPVFNSPASRDSFVGLWDDCLCRPVAKFCSAEMVVLRKPSFAHVSPSLEGLQDQWPNVTGFVRNFCLWRGEETNLVREGQPGPSETLTEKILWTYADLPYLLGYYAVGSTVTFCALSRSQQDHRVVRTDLCTFDLQVPSERVKSLVPCYRIAGLLTLLSQRCINGVNRDFIYNDFDRIVVGSGNGSITEVTPSTVRRFFSERRKWAAVKEIHDFLDHRVPHAEFVHQSNESELSLVFKPRGCRHRPTNVERLAEALMCVTKALVALHDLSFMHRRLGWDRVMRRVNGDGVSKGEWVVCGFEEAVGSPQIYPHGDPSVGGQAPEMGRGLHGVKVDVWGLGYLVKTSGFSSGLPKTLIDLRDRCLESNPELRPTAADCYRVLSQLQSSMSSTVAGGRNGSGLI